MGAFIIYICTQFYFIFEKDINNILFDITFFFFFEEYIWYNLSGVLSPTPLIIGKTNYVVAHGLVSGEWSELNYKVSTWQHLDSEKFRMIVRPWPLQYENFPD